MKRRYQSVKCLECVAVSIKGQLMHETGCHGHFVYRHGPWNYHRFRVWAYDVWGNAKDGFEVNDRSEIGTVDLGKHWSDERIFKELRREGYIAARKHARSFEFDNLVDTNAMEINVKRTGEPVLTLEIV